MPIPQPGEILIRSLIQHAPDGGFELVDAVSLRHLDGPFQTLGGAVAAARARRPRAIWQQNADKRGRPLGDPFRLPG
jgi:hypothetical protein